MLFKSSFIWLVTFATTAITLGYRQAQFHKLPNGGEIKAVLIAGSKNWKNYDMEADVCHAYQVLRGNGIPEENIILMIYDDIAFNEMNPDKGVIINRPGGPNVYKNIKKDYTGKDVTKKVFFDVLLGNKEAVKKIGSGRVLESGPNDHVFIYFNDHGLPGYLCMPDDDFIAASEFLQVLEKMSTNHKFQKMFVFIDTCYSGSVGKLVPNNTNIYTMTSAKPHESSFKCYKDTRLNASINDETSVFFFRDAETTDLRKITVKQEYSRVKGDVNHSHVSEYGDYRLHDTKMSQILGYREQPMPAYPIECKYKVSKYDADIFILEQNIEAAQNIYERIKLQKELRDLLQNRKGMVEFFSNLAEAVLSPDKMNFYEETISKKSELTRSNLECYERAVARVKVNRGDMFRDPFIGTQMHVLINLCNLVPEALLMEKINMMSSDK